MEQRIQLEASRDQVNSELGEVRERLNEFTHQRKQTRVSAQYFESDAAKVYRDPVSARRAIRDYAHREGAAKAASEVKSQPERFGALRGAENGPVSNAERRHARNAAEQLSRSTQEYFNRSGVSRGQQHDYRQARDNVAATEVRVRELDAELARGRGASEIRLQVKERLRDVQPQRRNEVSMRLSPSQRLLLGTSLAAGLAFAREQGHER